MARHPKPTTRKSERQPLRKEVAVLPSVRLFDDAKRLSLERTPAYCIELTFEYGGATAALAYMDRTEEVVGWVRPGLPQAVHAEIVNDLHVASRKRRGAWAYPEGNDASNGLG